MKMRGKSVMGWSLKICGRNHVHVKTLHVEGVREKLGYQTVSCILPSLGARRHASSDIEDGLITPTIIDSQ